MIMANYKRIMLTAIATLLAIAANAYSFSIKDVGGCINSVVDLSVSMDNETAISAFECQFVLPEGLEFVKDNGGGLDFTLGNRARKSHFILSNQIAKGVVKVASYSESSTNFLGNDGTLFTGKLLLTGKPGVYEVLVNNIIQISSDGTEHLCRSERINVTITESFSFTGNNTNGLQNSSVKIPISLSNASSVSAFECDIELPEGIEFCKTANGDIDISFCGRESNTHSLVSNVISKNKVKVASYSSQSNVFAKDGGELFSINLKLNGEPGDYYVVLKNISVASEYGNDYECADVSIKVTIQESANTDITKYENVVYVNNAESRSGSQATLSVLLNNTTAVYGYQFELHLPEGITVATETDAYGDVTPCVTLTTTRTSATRHTLESSINNGVLTVLCYSTKKYSFVGNEGEVAQIVLDIAEDVESGDYPIIIKAEAISLSESTPEIDHIKSILTISDFKLGDANGDTKVNVGDITAIAGYILGSPSNNFVFKGADANGDNKVNVGDITTIAGMILNGTANEAKQRSAMTTSSAQFGLDDVVLMRRNKVVVPVFVENTESAFSSFQFHVNLPEGFKVEAVSANANRAKFDYLQCADIDNGVCRVLGYSINERMVRGTEGEVVYLTLSADDVLDGTYDLSISNGVFAKGNSTIESPEVKAVITVADATNIFGVASPNQMVTVYDVNGRMIKEDVEAQKCIDDLPKGVYIVNGVKVLK